MLQAITVRWIPATNTKPTRLKAFCLAGTLTLSRYELNDSEDMVGTGETLEKQAAIRLIQKLGWTNEHGYRDCWHGGRLVNGDAVFVFGNEPFSV